jgi:hypothetical protein
MKKVASVVAGLVVLMATAAVAAPSDEVTFKTGAKAPSGFDSWTFFWHMPKIDPDASLTYVVVQPDGKEYMVYDKPIKGPAGQSIRSDFSKDFAGGDPAVLHNQDIVIRFRVDKGKIKFDPKATFRFEFRSSVKAVKE